jgi:hypothetical protein
MRSSLPILLILSALSAACISGGTLNRRLLVTEVGRDEVELYLDEDPSQRLILKDAFHLSVRTDDGAGNLTNTAVGLGAGDQEIQGGTFFIIWEESGYQGPPVAAPFSGGQQGLVPGIKVASTFLNGIKDFPSEVRLHGSRNRVTRVVVIFPETTTDRVDDVVRFGAPVPNRPASGGTFTATGALANPSGSTTLQRHFSGGAPVDTDHEDDWVLSPSSWGVPTP